MNHWPTTAGRLETRNIGVSGVCCLALLSLLGEDKVFLPGSAGYNASLSSYFSQQESQVYPRCIVSPASTEDVSKAVRSLSSTAAARWEAEGGDLDHRDETGSGCLFAVRSGGHAGFAGAANVRGGVTIDLRRLSRIEVYSKLDQLGLGVAGGRAAQVGVGGLVTGGGISYASPRFGFSCDTVSSYQVVLADGAIVEASNQQDADLAFALRGGSNNFGIVTRVVMQTFEQAGPIWGGSVYYSITTVDDQLKAFVDISAANSYDEYSSLITSFGFASGQGTAVVNSIEYTKVGEANPPVFAPLMAIPSLLSTMRLDSMTNISIEQGAFSPDGRRQLSVVTTHASTLAMLNATYINYNRSLAAVEQVADMVWSISLDPLPPAIYARPQSQANALGLAGRSTGATLVVAQLSASWTDASDDDAVEQAARDLFEAIERDARALDAYDPFRYLNYAAPWQDPIASYGPESVQRLREIRRRVDPRGVFPRQVPGGFKIPKQAVELES
ncbi:putative oxidoreductase [Bombardia bombarda]|uniref:Oxidoreductase n=1 Tax=Bombardia bombarda TaxID=252184 RepID=A0AA39XIF5_9PEZI|nr:putative oxidoreductase [Bombardia bombarda]